MSIVNSGLGCPDCFSTCHGDLKGLGDCGFQPSTGDAAGYQSWLECINKNANDGAGNASAHPVQQPTACPTGFKWDGLYGLNGCIPIDNPYPNLPNPGIVNIALPDSAFVTNLYQTLLNRTPSTNEVSDWVKYINVNQMTKEVTTQAFLNSPEYINDQKILAARNCPTGFHWDGVDGLGWLNGCIPNVTSKVPNGTLPKEITDLIPSGVTNFLVKPVTSIGSFSIEWWMILGIGGALAAWEFNK